MGSKFSEITLDGIHWARGKWVVSDALSRIVFVLLLTAEYKNTTVYGNFDEQLSIGMVERSSTWSPCCRF